MKSSSASKIALASYDDIFQTDASREDAALERVVELPLVELHSFENHPFKVRDDNAMRDTAESIEKYGVLVPGIARPRPAGGYELVAGHRRKRGSELAGRETMPVLIRDLDDDAAIIIMVDSNLQRESLLFSELRFNRKKQLKHYPTSDWNDVKVNTIFPLDRIVFINFHCHNVIYHE